MDYLTDKKPAELVQNKYDFWCICKQTVTICLNTRAKSSPLTFLETSGTKEVPDTTTWNSARVQSHPPKLRWPPNWWLWSRQPAYHVRRGETTLPATEPAPLETIGKSSLAAGGYPFFSKNYRPTRPDFVKVDIQLNNADGFFSNLPVKSTTLKAKRASVMVESSKIRSERRLAD